MNIRFILLSFTVMFQYIRSLNKVELEQTWYTNYSTWMEFFQCHHISHSHPYTTIFPYFPTCLWYVPIFSHILPYFSRFSHIFLYFSRLFSYISWLLYSFFNGEGRCPLSCLHHGRLQRELAGERGTVGTTAGCRHSCHSGHSDPGASIWRGKVMDFLTQILWGFLWIYGDLREFMGILRDLWGFMGIQWDSMGFTGEDLWDMTWYNCQI